MPFEEANKIFGGRLQSAFVNEEIFEGEVAVAQGDLHVKGDLWEMVREMVGEDKDVLLIAVEGNLTTDEAIEADDTDKNLFVRKEATAELLRVADDAEVVLGSAKIRYLIHTEVSGARLRADQVQCPYVINDSIDNVLQFECDAVWICGDEEGTPDGYDVSCADYGRRIPHELLYREGRIDSEKFCEALRAGRPVLVD